MGQIIDFTREEAFIKHYFPSGGVWNKKNIQGSNLSILIYTFAYIFNEVRQYNYKLNDELNILHTKDWIVDWEHFVGIPDQYINSSQTLSTRIQNVLFKLIGMKIRTIKELKNFMLTQYNVNINIINAGQIGFNYDFDLVFSDSHIDNLITIITIKNNATEGGFDYDFNFDLGKDLTYIELIIKSLAPFDKVGLIRFEYI